MPRYTCPRCDLLLDDHRVDGLRVYPCRQCEGHVVALAQLRSRMPEEGYRAMWKAARQAPAAGPGCAVCRKPMRAVMTGSPAVEVDVCIGCQVLWLDAGEQEKLGVRPSAASTRSPEQQAALQAADRLLAADTARAQAEQHRRKKSTERRRFAVEELVDALLWFMT